MIQIEHDQQTHCYRRRSAAWWRRSWITSSIGHALLVVFLATDLAALFFVLLGLSAPPAGKQEPIMLEVYQEAEQPPEAPPQMFIAVDPYDKSKAFAAAEAVAGRMDFEDPAFQQPLDYDLQTNEVTDSPVNNMQEFIRQSLNESISQADQQSTEENLDRLDDLAQQLENSSSADSINSVTGMIGNMLGTKERATRPAEEPVEGDFDPESGQLHDVIRREKDPEGYTYVAMLIDSEGRQLEVELTGPEGKQAFDTFEKIKRYPFLDKIYRNVVMSLLEGVLPQ